MNKLIDEDLSKNLLSTCISKLIPPLIEIVMDYWWRCFGKQTETLSFKDGKFGKPITTDFMEQEFITDSFLLDESLIGCFGFTSVTTRLPGMGFIIVWIHPCQEIFGVVYNDENNLLLNPITLLCTPKFVKHTTNQHKLYIHQEKYMYRPHSYWGENV